MVVVAIVGLVSRVVVDMVGTLMDRLRTGTGPGGLMGTRLIGWAQLLGLLGLQGRRGMGTVFGVANRG